MNRGGPTFNNQRHTIMKHTRLVITVFSVAAFAVTVGCKQESNVQSSGNEPTNASAQLDRMKQETKEAAEATKDYAYAQKAEYSAKIRAEVAALNNEIDQLSAKVESSSASTKDEAKAKLQEVRDKLARVGENVDSATESTWEEVKAGAKKGYAEAKDAVEKARQWISEKIAP